MTTTEVPLSVLTPDNVAKDSADVPVYPTNFRDLYEKSWLAP